MGFPRQESWSGLQFPSPGDLPDQGILVACVGRWILYHWATREAAFLSISFAYFGHYMSVESCEVCLLWPVSSMFFPQQLTYVTLCISTSFLLLLLQPVYLFISWSIFEMLSIFWIMLLWALVYTSLAGHMFSFLLGMYLGVELLCLRIIL